MAAYFYILANETNEVLYKGSTTDLIRRTYEHK
ncbi:GIY-YIG nuclease family protein, partial [uncultured Anaerococcus sp.]